VGVFVSSAPCQNPRINLPPPSPPKLWRFWRTICSFQAVIYCLLPLVAVSLPEGRNYDQAHDSGYIDWSGPVSYVYLTHRDGTYLPCLLWVPLR
jgi:hypothetical protein